MSQNQVLDVRAMGLLIGGIGLAIAPHLTRLPLWFALVMIGLGLWRYFASLNGWRLPKLLIRLSLVAAVIAGIYYSFNTLVGRDAGVSLLVVMMGLKLLELRQRRDVLVIMILAYFALSTHFLYSQSIGLAIYVAISTWLLVGLHIYLSQNSRLAIVPCIKKSLLLIAQAAPLAVALFLLFPRISGPLWGLPEDAFSAMTGLSDELTPGAISQLGQSDAVAFRVSFAGDIPSAEKRYWRGPVLWDTDGKRWRNMDNGYPNTSLVMPKVRHVADPVSYTVTLEPHNQRWLFALDIASEAPDFGQLSADYQVIASKNIRERVRYTMTSYTQYNTGQLPSLERQRALAIPLNQNPKTLALGQQLRLQLQDDQKIVNKMLAMYRTQLFTYTLNPPLLLTENTMDEFLFQSLKGFCEHFAASFTLVMRAAGIPARIVTGYQGGETNPLGNYLIVRQHDAHAWAEVWLKGQGWVRVDPTAAVAPERIEQSIAQASSQEGAAIKFDVNPNILYRLMKQVGYGLDTVNNAWNQSVLGFDQKAQVNFLRNLGLHITSWQDIVRVLVIILFTVIAIAALVLIKPARRKTDPVQTIYNRFCKKLARQGLLRHSHETARDYALRVGSQRPDIQQNVNAITSLYDSLRYSPVADSQQMSRFKRLVKKFRA